jgi:periplasmic copper chaperone A
VDGRQRRECGAEDTGVTLLQWIDDVGCVCGTSRNFLELIIQETDMKLTFPLVLGATLLAVGAQACDLKVESAWIREAPSTATALAGYAVLSNAGSKALSVVSAQSAAFAKVELHESLTENGVAKMRAIEKLEIAPGAKVEFAPGGKHFMLINPKPGLKAGDAVAIKIKDSNNCEVTAQFKVSSDAASAMDHMDHSKMNHSGMDMSKMDHATMQH